MSIQQDALNASCNFMLGRNSWMNFNVAATALPLFMPSKTRIFAKWQFCANKTNLIILFSMIEMDKWIA